MTFQIWCGRVVKIQLHYYPSNWDLYFFQKQEWAGSSLPW